MVGLCRPCVRFVFGARIAFVHFTGTFLERDEQKKKKKSP